MTACTCSFTPPTFFSTKKAVDLTQGYVKSIHEDIDSLQHQIVMAGDNIIKRWRRKSCSDRKDFLLRVDPRLYDAKVHHPDLYNTNPTLIDLVHYGYGQLEYRWAYLLPYFNIECLASDWRNVIGLLHYRAFSPPEKWVCFDNAQI